MKILIANYRYFVSGGPERYMFGIEKALSARGHQVIPFSVRYDQNQPTPYSRYFVEPLGRSNEVYFRQQQFSLKTFANTLSRLFYAEDVYQAVSKLVRETQPQVAYVLHYLRKLSPSLLVGLKHAGVPVIVRLSDYAMLCPQSHFFRDEQPCELCLNGNLLPSIKFCCVQGSLPVSVLNAAATTYHRWKHYFDLIDKFVVTNEFMYKKMLEAGYAENRLYLLPTFVDTENFHPETSNQYRKLIVYIGRLEHIKGVHILIAAFALLLKKRPNLAFKLTLVGDGDTSYVGQLKKQVQSLGLDNAVVFSGRKDIDQIVSLLGQTYITVVPSLWYENLPNAILESFACGVPVLASELGSLTECISESETGYLFRAGDVSHLVERLEFCIEHPELIEEMGHQARLLATTRYSKEAHLQKIENLFALFIKDKII